MTLASLRELLGDDHPDTLTSMNNIAAVLEELGDPQGAHSLYERALAGFRRVLGEDHPKSLP